MQYEEHSLEEVIAKLRENSKKADTARIKKAVALIEKYPNVPERRQKNAHVINTAFILAESELDEETILAGLLHHLTRDYNLPEETIEKEIGKETAELVKGVEKTGKIETSNRNTVQTEILSKLILATAKDIRIIFIHIASRLELLRAMDFLPEQMQKETAKSALEIYVPICHKLGLHKMRWKLEDLAMKILYRDAYEKLKREITGTREEREKEADEIAKEAKEKLAEKGLDCTVYGRAKNFYRIFKKSTEQGKKLSEIHDLLAFRVLCNNEKECYEALSALQESYRQMQEDFTDYVIHPKPNGYQSIHAVFLIAGKPVEAQIRTWEMHKNAEDGLAAHWQYKQYKKDKYFDSRLSIAKQLTEWQHSAKDSRELFDSMKIRFEGNKVFVFTPKHQLIELEEGATPVDFAFALHSELGLKCERARVNGKAMPLSYKLENGDTIEIGTSEKQTAKQQWLSFVKTEKAKQRIRQALEIPIATEKPKNIIEKILNFSGLTKKRKNLVRTAKCCNPVPGDSIVGVRTTKRKVVIHRADCANIANLVESKKVPVPENVFEKGNYNVLISIDTENRPGALPEIFNAISSFKAAINSTNAKMLPNNTMNCTINIKIRNIAELEKIMERIRKLQSVKRAERA